MIAEQSEAIIVQMMDQRCSRLIWANKKDLTMKDIGVEDILAQQLADEQERANKEVEIREAVKLVKDAAIKAQSNHIIMRILGSEL